MGVKSGRVEKAKKPTTGAVEALSRTQLTEGLVQMTRTAGFAKVNRHLSQKAIAKICRGKWPKAPVFTPYASGNQYTQSKRSTLQHGKAAGILTAT